MANIGRNDPCPCGSGKKYKKCCMDVGTFAAPFTREDLTTATHILIEALSDEAMETELDRAADDFYGLLGEDLDEKLVESELGPFSQTFFDQWFMFDRKNLRGVVPASALIDGPLPSGRVKVCLEALRDCRMSVYQILKPAGAHRWELEDLVTRSRVTITVAASEANSPDFSEGSVFGARILAKGPTAGPELYGIPLFLNEEAIEQFVGDFEAVLEGIADEGGDVAEAYRDVPPIVHAAWAIHVFDPEYPDLPDDYEPHEHHAGCSHGAHETHEADDFDAGAEADVPDADPAPAEPPHAPSAQRAARPQSLHRASKPPAVAPSEEPES